ncbi:MAG: DUF3784 domain-containing protein [Bacteroidia bacterium]|nr:DUF3784 domain-containing protein [Bacteroidia bacterium]
MLFAELLTGIILIFCGLLVKKKPNLIAGYNTLNIEEQKKIDVNKLSTVMRNYLIVIGCLSIIFIVISYMFQLKESLRLLINISFILLGIFILVIKGQRFPKD